MKITLERLTARLLKITEGVMALVGAELVVVVAYGVVKRYIFKTPIPWGHELSILSFLWVSFLGAAVALKTKCHVQFDVVVDLFPARIAKALTVLRDLVVLSILAPGTVYGTIIFTHIYPQQFQTLPLSLGWMYLALPVGFLLMSIFMVEILVEDLRGFMNKECLTHKES